MESRSDVESFLSQLRTKAEHYGIAFRGRDKNTQGLADLDIIPIKRKEIINKLTYKDFVSGPNKDNYEPGAPDYYVFGRLVNGEMAYIKISLGKTNKMVDCMSFHKAEYKLNFPLSKV